MDDWALIRRLAADGVPHKRIAEQLKISRTTVVKAVGSSEQPRYQRSARNASGARLRIRAAGMPATKTLDDFDFDHQPTARSPIQALASGVYLAEHRNVVLLGPPGTGKTHLATALGVAACHQGHRVLFATATEWVARRSEAHDRGRRAAELARLRRYGLIIANLFFQLVSSRHEHASLMLTSNLPFSSWGTLFDDQVVAAAMIDRIVHHADVIALKERPNRPLERIACTGKGIGCLGQAGNIRCRLRVVSLTDRLAE